MKRLLAAALAFTAPVAAFAGTYTFTDSLPDLAHGTAYGWGLSGANLTTLENGHNVTGGTLTITGLYDWTVEPDDVLYVNILNGLTAGNTSFDYDNSPATYDSSYGPDYFTAAGSTTNVKYAASTGAQYSESLIKTAGSVGPGTYTEVNSTAASTLTIQLSGANIALLNQYLLADKGTLTDLGLGLGPDCHFYDTGISLVLTTPDGGATLAMLGLGLLGVLGFSRSTKSASIAA